MNNVDLRQQILWELFVFSNQFLKDLKVDYWVNFGTLLGFYREQDIIGHDIDIDFGCHERHYPEILANQNKLHPDLTLCDTTSRHNGPKLYMSYKGFDADIYFYKEEENQLYSHEKTDWKNYNAPISPGHVYPTKAFEIKGIKTRIPNDTQAYLKTIYGCLEKGAIRNPETGYWEKVTQ
jgi:phosphorylcholine metabolism protein LicD